MGFLSAQPKLLVIDFDPDGGTLLQTSLAQKFPASVTQVCKDSKAALEWIRTHKVDAVVLHRTEEHDAVALVRSLRSVEPDAVIIVLSGIDRSEQVLAAGATGFLDYHRWLLIGTVVANALASRDNAGELRRRKDS